MAGRGGYRPGAGRKKGSFTAGEGMPTYVVRVSTEVSKEEYQALPEYKALITHFEDEYFAAKARGETCRTYEKMIQLIDGLRAAGLQV